LRVFFFFGSIKVGGVQMSIQNCDIVFVCANEDDFSSAINESTQTEKKKNFDHVGIIEVENDEIFVLHAYPEVGVIHERLEDFCNRIAPQKYEIYRLENSIGKDTVLARAKAHLGKPYNASFIRSDKEFYCADFVYDAFKNENIFTLEPMSFRATGASEPLPFWQDYYKKLKMEIPEGELGTNPNLIFEQGNFTI
jgi:hypothetical protein